MNVVNLFRSFAEKDQTKVALLFPDKNKSISRGELLSTSHQLAAGLICAGAQRGDYALIFLKPSSLYHALILALLEQGIIPVFIDPGMGRKNLFNCIKEVNPKILIAEKILFYLKPFFRKQFKSIKICISKSKTIFPKVIALKDLLKHDPINIYQDLMPDETCAVLYTSGGTGAPKGVEYNHQIFIKQVEYLKEMFKLTEDDIDVPGFPLFSMFTLCMGMCSANHKCCKT
jgi:acyl-coenzyme A synthetase/AMP-(fatty) acid ligase